MSALDDALAIRDHSVGIGSYVYSEADVILPVATIKALSDEEIVLAVRHSTPMAEALRTEEDAHRELSAQRAASPPLAVRQSIPGQVYLVRDHAGYFKIGLARRAHDRAFGISIALPFPVTLLARREGG